MLEIYLDPCTVNSRKVLAGLDLLGTQYHLNHVDYFTGAHKGPDYLKINPHGTLPSAVDGTCTITESNAILQYAADHSSDSSYYPKDLKHRALVNRWLLWEASIWFQSNYLYLVEYVVKPLLKAEPDQSVIDAHAPKWKEQAAILDAQLAKTKWLAGDQLTIADIAVAAPMHPHAEQRLPLGGFPNLKRWLEEGQKTQGAVNKALAPPTTNGVSSDKYRTPAQVRATFNYTKDVDGLTEIYFYECDAAKDVHEPGDAPYEMAVTDGWNRVKSISVDKEGFSLHDFNTGYDKWEDDEGVRANFYPEVVDFLKSTTGAKRILVFDHTIRTKTNAAKPLTDQKNTSQRAPVMLVHCDYTSDSAPLRVRQLLPSDAEDLLSRRVAFFNVWKPIRNVVQERPLAMCDVTSTKPEDFFKLHLHYSDRDGENHVMRHSPEHRWIYFPKITTEQVILLKSLTQKQMDAHASWVIPPLRIQIPRPTRLFVKVLRFGQ
ncbi:Glutathione S-transferase 3 [Hyphodiscus hymeniophilus]|uniref:Glutathione S-transferase 3 n=1 Tax=Hyphodiscus hymeniophilus TaxID=353542 RepID=A0A9P7AYF6_9HELO|nr:Glutathione S-transferase 3 [Hyphodiscus hymeniophilus]